MVKEMELTLENLVNEIIKQEFEYHNSMVYAKYAMGIDSKDFHYWNSKWSVLYNLAKKFDFVDKLQR